MKIGNLFILLALASVLFSAWRYLKVSIKENHTSSKRNGKNNSSDGLLKLARQGFVVMTIFVGLASFYLFYLILSHQFQFDYVYRYTSRSLSFGLLLSAFWAGQEGSFLLWALLIAIMGLLFIRTRRRFEAQAMLIVSVVQTFFLFLLFKASPFVLLPQNPPDGAGLNPLLQNFWMIIHPPILFVGYAAITFPMAIALAALLKREYKNWMKDALPWTLFSAVTLGAGIIIGAFWAYEVLGWGGYWGWDPVENSSLIPWIIIIALFHGLLVQNRFGLLGRTNFVLAIAAFILVIYATFLTRSGVLADFSVHSFQDLGLNSFLIFFMLFTLGFSLWIFIRRFREIPVISVNLKILNRENILILGVFILTGSALFILMGTSSPLLTDLIGNPSQVEISYYNKVNLPFGIAMGILLGLAPFLAWKENGGRKIKRIIPSIILTIVTGVIAVFAGLNDLLFLLFLTAASFGFWSNSLVLIKQIKGGWQHTGAPVAHIGLGLMLAAIMISGYFSQKETVVLTEGIAGSAFGRQLIYQGTSPQPNGKDIINIQVSNGQSKYQATPRFYYSEFNQSMMREPHIKTSILKDFYVAPIQKMDNGSANAASEMILVKGEKKQIAGYEILFTGFKMSNHADGKTFQIGANLQIRIGDQLYPVTPALVFSGGKQESESIELPVVENNGAVKPKVLLSKVDADAKKILLNFEGLENETSESAGNLDQLVVEVSVKPFMNILWFATILLTVGTCISLVRRIKHR